MALRRHGPHRTLMHYTSSRLPSSYGVYVHKRRAMWETAAMMRGAVVLVRGNPFDPGVLGGRLTEPWR